MFPRLAAPDSSRADVKLILPERYGDLSAYELLAAASRGHIAFDHRLLHALLDKPSQTAAEIARFANELERAGDRIDLGEELEHIFATCPTAEALPFLLERLRGEEEAPEVLIIAFSRLGPQAVSALIKAFEHSGRDAGDVPFVLATLGVRDGRIVDTLVSLIDADPEHALFCLDLYGGQEVIEALQKKLESLPAEDEEVREQIEAAIDDTAGEGRPAPHEEFDIWEHFPETAEPDLRMLPEDELEAFLESPSAAQRLAAVECFEGLPAFTQQHRSRLLRMAKEDSDARVRGACWSCLYAQSDEPALVEEMRRRMAEGGVSHEELSGIVLALAEDAYDEGVRQAILQLYEAPASRAPALGAMWRSEDPRFEPYFGRHLEDDDEEVCRQAVLGVGFLGLAHEAPRLRKWFDAQDLREDALYAYALAAPGLVSRSQARWFLSRVEDAAGGLGYEEESLVMAAIDLRLQRLGLRPAFARQAEEARTLQAVSQKVGRNEPCPCGSGKKFKKCCGV